jgi:hypothetical protein
MTILKSHLQSGSENGPDSIKTKADATMFLKDSFAYLHKATLTVDAANIPPASRSNGHDCEDELFSARPHFSISRRHRSPAVVIYNSAGGNARANQFG